MHFAAGERAFNGFARRQHSPILFVGLRLRARWHGQKQGDEQRQAKKRDGLNKVRLHGFPSLLANDAAQLVRHRG
ncbi:MAG TPA: hypothetical protein PKD31_28305 [Blastocatellia bacterium]|nr:hypothetical protein [Blastocatellia bacterium]